MGFNSGFKGLNMSAFLHSLTLSRYFLDFFFYFFFFFSSFRNIPPLQNRTLGFGIAEQSRQKYELYLEALVLFATR